MSDELLPDDPFSFDHDLHEYRNAAGLVRPSVTATLTAGGVFNYDNLPPSVKQQVERKKIIGSNVHKWTADHDLSERNMDDVMALYPEERGYADSYLRFLDTNMPHIEWIEIEKGMLSEIGCFEMGGTPDRFLRWKKLRLFHWDLKTAAAFHPGWRLQLADYNMMRSKRSTCAIYGRATLRLMADGRMAKLDIIPPEYDAVDSATAAALVTSYVWRKNHRLI